MTNRIREILKERELFVFCISTVLLLMTAAFILAPPQEIAKGMITIILTRDALVTDYFELAGYGAAFFNAGLVMGLGIFLIRRLKIPFTGFTMAVLFINAGFALFGKNPINVLPMLLGTWLYAKFHNAGMNRYIYTALFGSCLAPMVTELVYLLPLAFGGICCVLWRSAFSWVLYCRPFPYILLPCTWVITSLTWGLPAVFWPS